MSAADRLVIACNYLKVAGGRAGLPPDGEGRGRLTSAGHPPPEFSTTVYNRGQGCRGANGGGFNAKTPGNPGFFVSACFRRPLLYPIDLQALASHTTRLWLRREREFAR
jgi:hypothetical protein